MHRVGAFWRVAWATLLLVGLAPTLAWAQGDLPDSSSTPARLDAFVLDKAEDLLSGDAERLSDARKDIVRTLQGGDVKVAFRNDLTRRLLPHLQQLLRNGSPAEKINALRIAGELATGPAADLLTAHLDDADVGVRFAATSGLERCFDAASRSAAAMSTTRFRGLVDALGRRLADEPDPAVFDASIRALDRAGQLGENLAAVRGPAQRMMAQGAADRLAKALADEDAFDAAWGQAWLRASLAARTALTNPQINVSPEARTPIARLAGLQLIWAARHAEEQGPSSLLLNVLRVSRGVMSLIGAASSPPVVVRDLAKDLSDGRLDALRQGVEEITGPNGLLTRPPFSVPAGDLTP